MLCGALTLIALAFPGQAAAFSTGYHYDLTADALVRENCSATAIQVAQVSNAYDDMFQITTQVLTDPRVAAARDQLDAIYGPAELRDLSERYEHFAGCPDYAALSAQWDRLLVGTWAAVQEVKERPEPTRTIEFLTILGQSLHVVQDFYAHSNWAEAVVSPGWSNPAGTVRDETWFDVPEQARQARALTVGPHDDMGKDWTGRPHFDRAYHDAFLAGWEWTRMLRAWAGEPLWRQAAAYTDYTAAQESRELKRVAMYVEEGYWKGPGSGDMDQLISVARRYLFSHAALWSSASGESTQVQDAYLLAWKRYCPVITADPQGKPYPTTLPSPVTRPQWLAVDTVHVGEVRGQGGAIDAGGLPDFTAVLTVNGVEYSTNVMRDADSFRPFFWKTLVPVAPDATVSLSYALFDEDETGDQPCDVAPGDAMAWTWSSKMAELPLETQTQGRDASLTFRIMRAPLTSVDVAAPSGRHGWYRGPVAVALAAQDFSGAGIDRVDYGISDAAGTAFSRYQAPFSLAREGATTLTVFATDLAGNIEDAQEKTFHIDSQSPTPVALNHPVVRRSGVCTLRYLVRDPLPSSGSVAVTITVRNAGGKLVKTIDVPWMPANAAAAAKFPVKAFRPGKYFTTISAVDYAGNPEVAQAKSSFTVK